MGRQRIYLKPFLEDGSDYDDWVEVTSDVLQLGSISQTLDVSEYNVGVFTNSTFSLGLRNSHGKYSDVDLPTSIFKIKRADSLIKVTWDPAERDYVVPFASSEDFLGAETVVFEGVLNDDSTLMHLRGQNISFDAMGYEALFERALIDDTWSGSPPASNLASTILKRILAIAAASTTVSVLTIDNLQVVPGNDITWDDLSVFINKTVKEALDLLLTGTNSVLYMDGTTPVVSARSAGAAVQFNFYGPASVEGRENIIDLNSVSSGLNRTFNVLTWITSENPPATNLSSVDSSSSLTYGTRKKNVTVDGLTTEATQQSVIDAIRTEFGTPKQELILITPMTIDALAISLLDRVTIDFPLIPTDPDPALYGSAQYGIDQYSQEVSSFVIDSASPFKVISRLLDPKNNQISLNLRRI